MRALSVLLVGGLIAGCAAAPKWACATESPGRGWYWYEVLEPDEEETPAPEASPPVAAASTALSPREILAEQGERWEDAMAAAVLEPTPENLRAYMELTAAMQDQAQGFATSFQRHLWVAPEFDTSLQRPVAPEALMAANEVELETQVRQLEAIAERRGLIYFFRSDCPYCVRFSPIVARFAAAHGFTIIPVTMDGKGLPDFPTPEPNVALAGQLGVETVPAVYLVDPEENRIAPVAFGFRDWMTLSVQVIHASTTMDDTAVVAGVNR